MKALSFILVLLNGTGAFLLVLLINTFTNPFCAISHYQNACHFKPQILMTAQKITVRHLEINDHEKIVNYFLNADIDFLTKLGVDPSKLPAKQEWLDMLILNFAANLEQKKIFLYYLAFRQQASRSL